ncbi:hypothetical protein B0H17DRAFT_1130021 [Mycena rosella]|uniref:Uncharacterized protein n=1 Tax=Mycena rosella TaxID=1033263 RepID=A0AAD7GMM6_MYCRO|nr:hypothetical protein B0H17DRAFT_1130021 [Mycena rosella]
MSTFTAAVGRARDETGEDGIRESVAAEGGNIHAVLVMDCAAPDAPRLSIPLCFPEFRVIELTDAYTKKRGNFQIVPGWTVYSKDSGKVLVIGGSSSQVPGKRQDSESAKSKAKTREPRGLEAPPRNPDKNQADKKSTEPAGIFRARTVDFKWEREDGTRTGQQAQAQCAKHVPPLATDAYLRAQDDPSPSAPNPTAPTFGPAPLLKVPADSAPAPVPDSLSSNAAANRDRDPRKRVKVDPARPAPLRHPSASQARYRPTPSAGLAARPSRAAPHHARPQIDAGPALQRRTHELEPERGLEFTAESDCKEEGGRKREPEERSWVEREPVYGWVWVWRGRRRSFISVFDNGWVPAILPRMHLRWIHSL